MTSSCPPAPRPTPECGDRPAPLVRSLLPPVTGIEIRPLEPGRCVLSVGENHHVADLPAQVAELAVAAWTLGRDDLVAPDAAKALAPLRRLLSEQAGRCPAGVPRGPAPVPRPGLRVVLSGERGMVEALERRSHPQDSVEVVAWSGARAVVNRAFALRRLLMVAVRGAREADLVDVDRMCHDMRVPWLPVELVRARMWVGPLVTPGVGASYEDAACRRLAAAREPRVHRVLRTPPAGGDQGPAPEELWPVLDVVLDLAAQACSALADADQELAPGDLLHELALSAAAPWPDAPSGAGQETPAVEHLRHPVLPVAHRRTRHRHHVPEDLLDERTGLVLRVREVRHDRRVPAALVTRQADVGDIRAVSPWANNILCQGSSFGDPRAARDAALGESVERYCGNVLDTLPVTWASYRELRRRGVPALDPRELVLYSRAQYEAPGFPFVPLTRGLRVHWVPGRRLGDGSEVLVPASMVYVNWFSAGFAAAPPTNFCAFAGIAAGPDEDFAVAGALEEIIERHATMVWWLNAHPLAEVSGLAAPALDPPLRVAYLSLDNEFGVPVAAAVVHDDEAGLVNIGFSARPRLADAASKALTEALTLQEGSRDLLRADGRHWKVMADGELNGRAFKPWRADRRYLDDFRADMHDCDDLMVQQQVYLDPRAAARMSHLLEPGLRRPPAQDPQDGDRSAERYRRALERQGVDAIVVDITTSDVASTGMRVVRVIAPGTVGNAPAAFPFLGRRRVQDIAVELGWRSTPLEEDELNYFPMPHA
ncbi:bacteriocin biosynthesis docking scaffold, SagD family [Actinomyces howellii]|uniref:Bacteriocin biosynthesis docking scaffold, SagD family n=1 Tax=Actinomyces howellii TaxID=52771 RepID=A0A3S4RXA6_9ACTO|nr:bacteriocin biosynthesis docking scaffold, SagD family [Actinomyces howellii]